MNFNNDEANLDLGLQMISKQISNIHSNNLNLADSNTDATNTITMDANESSNNNGFKDLSNLPKNNSKVGRVDDAKVIPNKIDTGHDFNCRNVNQLIDKSENIDYIQQI